jgi:tetratricopeptide (TPR) repeat protein
MQRILEELSQAAGDLLEGGSPERALPLFGEAVAIAQAAGLLRELSDLLGDMAVAYRRTGDTAKAIESNRRAIEAAHACRYDLNVARWSGNLGGLLYYGGDLDGAEACFREAMAAASRSGDAQQMSIAGGHFGSVMGERGRFSEGIAELEKARGFANDSPDVLAIVRDQQTDLYVKWAYSLRQGRRLREARDVIKRALAGLQGAPVDKATIMLLILLGDTEEHDGNIVAAVAAVQRAVQACEAIGDREQATELRELVRRMQG